MTDALMARVPLLQGVSVRALLPRAIAEAAAALRAQLASE
jgi:hypothetical protein